MNKFSFFFKSIKNVKDLQAATTATYLADIVLALVFFVVFLIVANAILYERGRVDNSWKKRRAAFFIIGFLTLIGSIVMNYFLYFTKIGVAAFRTKYTSTMLIAAFVAALVYFVLSFVIVRFVSPKDSKLATVFSRK